MDIYSATDQDITPIVDLLKISLGEGLMPKSIGNWTWKHVNNPFGRSPVLVCVADGRIVGVRAFMRWQWRHQGRIVKTVRAVDTATHPEYQGKGIFKKLTLQLVDQCKADGDHFVFNTPNGQSRPGYLKMGWQVTGRLPVILGFHPVSKIRRRLFDGEKQDGPDDIKHVLNHVSLPELISSQIISDNSMTTNVTMDFLKWRYMDVPVANYSSVAQFQSGKLTAIVIYRVKRTKRFVEFRVCDTLISKACDFAELGSKLTRCFVSSNAHVMTLAGTAPVPFWQLLGTFRTSPVRLGPVVTIRILNGSDLPDTNDFSTWRPGIGDLELF